MWTNKLKELLKTEPGPPQPPRMVEVGRADVTVTESDGTKHEIFFEGKYEGEYPIGGDWIYDAQFYFRAWQERCGRTGTAGIGDGSFIPMCNVKRIDVKFSEKQVEAK